MGESFLVRKGVGGGEDTSVLVSDTTNQSYILSSGWIGNFYITPTSLNNGTNYLYTNTLIGAFETFNSGQVRSKFSRIGSIFNTSISNNVYIQDKNGAKYQHSLSTINTTKELRRFANSQGLFGLGSAAVAFDAVTVARRSIYLSILRNGQQSPSHEIKVVDSANFQKVTTMTTQLFSGAQDMVVDQEENFMYVSTGNATTARIQKFSLNNNDAVNTVILAGTSTPRSLKINNNFLYSYENSGTLTRRSLNSLEAFNSVSVTNNTFFRKGIDIHNGIIYTATATGITRYHETNFVSAGTNSSPNASIDGNISVNNGFLYTTSGGALLKYHLSNLTLAAQAPQSSGTFAIDNGFIWSRQGILGLQGVAKRYESNLAIEKYEEINTMPAVSSLVFYKGFIYGYAGANINGINSALGVYPFTTGDLTRIQENQWILDNNASGKKILDNVSVVTNNFTNGSNLTFVENNITKLQNAFTSNGFGLGQFTTLQADNDYLYFYCGTSTGVIGFFKFDLNRVNSGPIGNQFAITDSNGSNGGVALDATNSLFYYVKANILREHNAIGFVQTQIASTPYGFSTSMAFDNGFIYYSTNQQNNNIYKINAQNINQIVGTISMPSNIGTTWSLTVNNGFLYAGVSSLSGGFAQIRKYNLNNLALVNNSVNISGQTITKVYAYNNIIYALNGSISAGGGRVARFDENNLTILNDFGTNPFINSGTSSIKSLAFNGNFIYLPQGTTIFKYHLDNGQQFVTSPNLTAASDAELLFVNNNLYVATQGGRFYPDVYQGRNTTFDQIQAYRVNEIEG
jgi:hypothetical protein